MLGYRRPLYLDEAAHEVTFTVALAGKDMQVTTDLAEALGVPMPQARVTLAQLRAAEAAGYGARDMAAILDFTRRQAT
jgi:3-hydroxyisobutyrate dehydrogenase